MPFWKIAWRNIEQRALASSLTGLSMALGVAVMIAVIVIYNVTVKQFEQNAQGYHLIVGKQGGSLQLVLSTVYYVSNPLYPLPYTYYQKFVGDGEYAKYVDVAVPECLGDSYQSPDGSVFRVVATTPDMFDKLHYGNYDDGTPKVYEFQQGGRNFKTEHFLEGVVGSVVAAKSGLKIGDEIQPTHGIAGDGHKHEGFKIVGILKPTGTANDRAVFINIEGFYLQENHARTGKAHQEAAETAHDEPTGSAAEKDHHEEADKEKDHPDEAAKGHDHKEQDHADHDHDEHDPDHEHEHTPLPIDEREVTSILLHCKDFGELHLERAINKEENGIAQAVAPTREVTVLLDRIVGPIRIILMVLTVLIVFVAGISILVSIYNSMSERSHDIAVMRALGASRGAVMGIVLVESILLSLGGGLIGILLGHGVIGLVSPYLVGETGIQLSAFQFEWQELILIPALVLLASLVGFLPAMTAYRTDVAKALAAGR